MTRSRKHLTVVAATLACVCMAATPAAAGVLMLSDANSIASFDLESSAGLHSWLVDGTGHMYQQWFWFRLGDADGEASISTLTLDAPPVLSDLNADGQNDTVYARYLGAGLRCELWFILAGGGAGSGASDLGEIIRITNVSGSNLDLHFFQYADFNLSASGDTLEITGGDALLAGNTAHQTAPGLRVAETVVTPRPSGHQAGLAPDILGLLEDGSPTTLDNNSGPVTGDVAWMFQWDKVLAPGRTLLISKDKNIIPEPATLALMGGGLATVLVLRRRRRK